MTPYRLILTLPLVGETGESRRNIGVANPFFALKEANALSGPAVSR